MAEAKLFICPEKDCGKKFTRRFTLNRHYQNFHLNNELVEKCSLCGQLFESCEHLQKHYKFSHRPSRKFFLKESAFKKAFATYRYNFMESDINFSSAQLSVREKIKERLIFEAAKKTVCKASLIFICQMSMNDHAGNIMTSASIPFRSPGFIASAMSPRSIKSNIMKSFSFQEKSLEDFMRSGSNWQFERALAFDIEVANVRPITAGKEEEGLLNLKSINQKKFLYNPCNKDEKCFLYCAAHFLYKDKIPKKNQNKKGEAIYKKYIERFDIKKIDFPISIAGIVKFLKQNKKLNLKVNILYRNINGLIFPIEYGIGEGTKVMNLLMVEKKQSNHFLLIENVDKFLRKMYNSTDDKTGKRSFKKSHFCLHCLNSFSSKDVLDKHVELCSLNKPKVESTPEKGSKEEFIKFRNFERLHKLEYTGYLDFECCLPPCNTFCDICQRLKCKCDASFTDVLSKQIPIAFSFLILGPNKEVVHEYSFSGEDANVHLIRHLLDQEEKWIKNALSVYQHLVMTKENRIDFDEKTHCYLCSLEFSDENIKVKDHSHFNGKYLGAACISCNLRRRKMKRIPIFMHNGSRFDLHFIVKGLGKFGEEIKNLNVLPYNGENFRTLSFNSFEFVDSLAFLQSSLSQLANDLKDSNHDYKILKQTSLVKSNNKFDKEKYNMVLGKSFFPYEFCRDLNQMYSVKKLPKRIEFYSQLSEKSISKEEHKFAKSVWKKFGCRHLVDYTLIYCKIDVLILSEIFEAFRDEMLKFSGLDPSHYISLPAFSYDSMLKTTGSVIQLPTDINIVHFLENAKRGGMSVIGTRHLVPNQNLTINTQSHNKKNLTPTSGKQPESEETSEIVYIDANVKNIFISNNNFQVLNFTFIFFSLSRMRTFL